MTEQPLLARAPASRMVAIATMTLFSIAALAGELLSLPDLSLGSRMMLPASLFQVACTVPHAPPLVRFFPAVTGVPYLLCLVATGFALRSARGLPEARDAAEALGTVFLLATHAAIIGRMLVEGQRSGLRRMPWRLWTTLSGLTAALGAYLLWLWFDRGAAPGAIAFLVLPLSVWSWVPARDRRKRTRPTGAAAASSTPLEEVARRIAHAILKPVTAVAEQLRVVAPTIDDASGRAVLENAAQLMSQVQRLVRDLLDLARAQGERDARLLDLSKLIEQAVMELRTRSPDAEVEIDTTPGELTADEVALRCLVLNLLENATEAEPPGWVRVQTEWCGEWAQILVEDRAGGIADEVRDRIFEPFVTTKSRGTGLGLAVVREVVRAHGGRVSPQLTARGTRFVVTLPIAGS